MHLVERLGVVRVDDHVDALLRVLADHLHHHRLADDVPLFVQAEAAFPFNRLQPAIFQARHAQRLDRADRHMPLVVRAVRQRIIISEVVAMAGRVHRGRVVIDHGFAGFCVAHDDLHRHRQALAQRDLGVLRGEHGGEHIHEFESGGGHLRDDGAVARVRIGQELTRFTLHPGERVRTPLVALLFWRGDWVRGQNLWRKWMLAHNLPRPGGELPPSPQLNACSSHQFGEMIHADSASQVLFIDRYLEEGLPLDYWWMDAGWYPNESGWGQTGTWEVDQQRFPGGLRPITDHGHERGVRSIVWFEPERVATGAWLYETHPEWLLGVDGQQKLLNLGHPEAREWLTEHVHGLLESEGIDLYRQDFNMDPLSYWRANDAEDRQGITEIRHVEGYLAYWDELRRRHPNMLIDSCASGGRRNDLETLRRAVPLLRSDYIFEPVGNQAHTYGISFWMPFYGTGAGTVDAYAFRSVMCPSFTACYDMRRDDIGFDELRRLMGQWERVAPVMMMGDYYPLTEYSLANDVWIGWQFDLPDEGRGVIQVFRRADSIYQAAQLPLRGLDPSARYEVADVDTGEARVLTGAELIETGVPVRIDTRPGALLLEYRRVD